MSYSTNIQEPLLCITFDDANQSDVEIAYPYLKSKGLVATFMIITDWIDNPRPQGSRHPRGPNQWELYKRSLADGFALECHTHTHRSLTEITLEEVHEEMKLVNQSFLDQGLEPPKHHAFPRGLWNDDVVEIILRYRKSVMRVGTGYVEYGNVGLDRFPRVLPSEINSLERLQHAKRIVDQAIQDRKIAVTVQHRISDDGANGSLTHLWKEWIDYVATSGIRTVTIDEMVQMLTKVQEFNMEQYGHDGKDSLYSRE